MSKYANLPDIVSERHSNKLNKWRQNLWSIRAQDKTRGEEEKRSVVLGWDDGHLSAYPYPLIAILFFPSHHYQLSGYSARYLSIRFSALLTNLPNTRQRFRYDCFSYRSTSFHYSPQETSKAKSLSRRAQSWNQQRFNSANCRGRDFQESYWILDAGSWWVGIRIESDLELELKLEIIPRKLGNFGLTELRRSHGSAYSVKERKWGSSSCRTRLEIALGSSWSKSWQLECLTNRSQLNFRLFKKNRPGKMKLKEENGEGREAGQTIQTFKPCRRFIV